MSEKNIQLGFVAANLLFASIQLAFILMGTATLFTVFVLVLNLFAAKVCYDGARRSASR